MLHIDYYGETYKSAGHPDALMLAYGEEDWFNEEYVKDIVYKIDGSIVENPHAIIHPDFGLHNCYEISAGAKNIVLAYKTDLKLNADFMGDNCIPLLLDIADTKEVFITTTHIFILPEDRPINIELVNTGEILRDSDSYLKALLLFTAGR